MRVTGNFDIYSRNINLSSLNNYNNTSYPFFTSDKDDNKQGMSKKTKWTLGSICGTLLGALGIKSLLRKPAKIPVSNSEINPVITTAVDVIEDLITKLKPKNEELAREFFPLLEKYAQNFKLLPEDYNKILSGINKNNRKYLKEEGFGFISSQMEKIKDLIVSPAEDILSLINNLTKENQDVFTRIVNEKEKFRLTDIFDIATYLKHIAPEKQEYVFNNLLPLLERYANKLKIKTAEKHSKLLAQITPEIQDSIPIIANSKALETQNISKYQILLKVNKDNKDCVNPLLANIENIGLKQNEILNLLGSLHNEQAGVIGVVGKNINGINDIGLDVEELFTHLKDDNCAKIFDTVISNPQGYKIKEMIDLKNYIKNLNSKNLEFVDKVLLPKLTKYSDVLGIKYADEMAEVMGKLTPKTAKSIDTVAKYAQTLGDGVSYSALLQAITEENQANLPKLMENIQKTDVWENFMVSADDFEKLLAGG